MRIWRKVRIETELRAQPVTSDIVLNSIRFSAMFNVHIVSLGLYNIRNELK